MEKKNNRNSHIMMNKGMKQKVSVLLIACLLLTGYHGLTISGKAEQTSKSESNEISVSGTEVRVQLLGEDLRRAAREAIEKGTEVEGSFPEGYSGDGELQKEYEAIFSPEKEVYEIPLDSISEGLSESLSEEEAGLQIFVERDAKDLESLVRKENKESLLLYDGNSQLAQLFPERKKEEKQDKTEKAKELTEGAVASSSDIEETAVASDSNIERRNTELTGSELITFLYKNKSEHKISFKLSVDGNQYPKLVVAPKTQLFKGLLEKLKKEEKKAPAEVKPAEKQEEKPAETKEEQAKEEPVKAEASEEKKQLAEENAPVEEKKELSKKEEKPVSEVSIVSTEGKAEEAQPEAKEVEEKTEKREEQKEDKVETAEAESKEESAEKGVEAEKDGAKSAEAEKEAANTEKADEKGRFDGFLQEVLDHYEEFLAELSSARFRRYSLNELGRKTQNVEIKDFATVEVFYDEDAFADEEGNTQDVVLEAKRLVKPEEEGQKEGEKLTEEQVKAMKDQAIYDDSDALDIRFVSKNDRTKEIEPKVPVSVRLTFDKKAVPEEATADTIAIHHIVEDKDSGKVKTVETVVRSEKEKNSGDDFSSSSTRNLAGLVPDSGEGDLKVTESKVNYISEVDSEEESANSQKNDITKEFTVASFSAYVVTWKDCREIKYQIRFHYVDQNFREIGPTVYKNIIKNPDIAISPSDREIYYRVGELSKSTAYKEFKNFKFSNVGGIAESEAKQWGLYMAMPEIKGVEVVHIDEDGAWLYFKDSKGTVTKREYHRFVRECLYKDFFFIYHVDFATRNKHEKDITPTLSNEKFITDNQDGTYDLTLTGQVKKQQTKQNLDVLFVYDNTAVMATDFSFNEKANKLGEGNYASKNARKSEKVKAELKRFMGKLSNADCDVRYALVTMDGDKGYHGPSIKGKYSDDSNYKDKNEVKIKLNQFKLGADPIEKALNIVGDFKGKKGGTPAWLSEAEDDKGKSDGFNVTDYKYNDTKHLHGFTSNPQDIISTLDSLDETKSTFTPGNNTTVISGENYASAMKNVKALMGQGDYEGPSSGRINSDSKVRSDAEKIVIFIAGGNPKFATINEDGIYDDTQRDNATDYYMIRRNYEEGWSYGNGYSINFAALNQARGELSKLTNVDAFYSIGVGNSDNWKYLNDFAMGQGYNEEGKIIKVTENGVEDDFVKFHPDRRERALSKDVRYRCYDGSSAENLHTAFQGIYTRVARNQVQNIKITDVLTKYVQPIPQNNSALTGQLVKMKENGVEVDHVLSEQEMKDMGLEGFGVDASKGYDSDYGREVWKLTLTTKPADFSLPPGYDIRMVAKVKPTEDAEKLFKSNSGYREKGEERTDLNDIYRRYLGKEYPETVGTEGKFNSSAGKLGLFTNEVADISYKTRKPDGSEEGPSSKKYKKPIIARGSLTIEKSFKGLEQTKFLNDSTGGLTDFGKEILQQLRFEVHVQNLFNIKPDGQKEYRVEKLLTVNFKDDEPWWNGQKNFKEGATFEVKEPNNLTHNVTIKIEHDKDKSPQLKITVDNLIPSKQYTIYEYYSGEFVENKTKEVLDSEKGVSYRLVLDASATNGDKLIALSGGRSLEPSECNGRTEAFSITNEYKPKKLAPPTGLVRDIAPYLMTLFGFTLMAGAYFAINQKKRREI